MPSCKTCEFWDAPRGMCRRQPPTMVAQLIDGVDDRPFEGFWPETHSTDWCGEWVEKNREVPDLTAGGNAGRATIALRMAELEAGDADK